MQQSTVECCRHYRVDCRLVSLWLNLWFISWKFWCLYDYNLPTTQKFSICAEFVWDESFWVLCIKLCIQKYIRNTLHFKEQIFLRRWAELYSSKFLLDVICHVIYLINRSLFSLFYPLKYLTCVKKKRSKISIILRFMSNPWGKSAI